jgi:hypothetical protein
MKFLLFLALLPACFGASAQPAYPSRPITIIVPFGPGGVADITAPVGRRWPLHEAAGRDRQPPQRWRQLGSAAVAKAAPDGYRRC